MKFLEENGEIVVDGETVGVANWNENTLVDIFIDDDYRGEGIGTQVIGDLMEVLEKQGYEYIRTQTVISPAMEKVLRRHEFEKITSNEKMAKYLGLSEDIVEQTETVVWKKKL